MVNILNFKSHEQGASAEESSGSPSLMWIDTSQHLQVAAQLKTDWQKVRFSSLAHLGFPSVSKLISPVQAVVDYLSDIRTSVSRVHRWLSTKGSQWAFKDFISSLWPSSITWTNIGLLVSLAWQSLFGNIPTAKTHSLKFRASAWYSAVQMKTTVVTILIYVDLIISVICISFPLSHPCFS